MQRLKELEREIERLRRERNHLRDYITGIKTSIKYHRERYKATGDRKHMEKVNSLKKELRTLKLEYSKLKREVEKLVSEWRKVLRD